MFRFAQHDTAFMINRSRTLKIKPVCGERIACQRPSEAVVCDRVAAGVQE
jgi:hypothetical protein